MSAALTLAQEGTTALRAHNAEGQITRLIVSIGAPWSITLSRVVTYDHGEPIKITPPLIADLVESAENEITDALRALPLFADRQCVITERRTTGFHVNEYSVPSPIGLTGSTIHLMHSTGMVDADVVTAVTDIQQRLFPTARLSIHSALLVSFGALEPELSQTTSYALIAAIGNTTEIGIIEDGHLVETTSCPYGPDTVVREIAHATQSGLPHARGLISAYQRGELVDAESQSVREAFSHYETTLTSTLTLLGENRAIPHHALLILNAALQAPLSTQISTALTAVTHTEGVTDTATALLARTAPLLESDHVSLVIADRFFHMQTKKEQSH
jgi:hypothetical protein